MIQRAGMIQRSLNNITQRKKMLPNKKLTVGGFDRAGISITEQQNTKTGA